MCFFLDGNFVNRFFIVVFINKDASKDDIITENLFSRGGSGISQGFRENPGFPVFRVTADDEFLPMPNTGIFTTG